MAVIASTNLHWHLSGTASNNTDPAASIGGAISTVPVVAATIFDDVTGDEALAGLVTYRCVFFQNADDNATGLTTGKAWLTGTPATGETIAVAITGSGTATTVEVAATETGTVAALTWSTHLQASAKSAGLSLTGTLGPSQCQAIWLRRSIGASCAATNNDTWTLNVEGDSTA